MDVSSHPPQIEIIEDDSKRKKDTCEDITIHSKDDSSSLTKEEKTLSSLAEIYLEISSDQGERRDGNALNDYLNVNRIYSTT